MTKAPGSGLHGQEEPFEIRRYRAEELIPLQRTFAEERSAVLGLPAVAGHNDVRSGSGVSPGR